MRSALRTTLILAMCAIALEAAAPQGWFMAGSKPSDYEANVDAQTAYNGKPSASVTSKKPVIDGFGTLMQNFSADKYLGQRVRFSAFVKATGVQDWAGLWMRIDGSGQPPKMLGFDNMMSRPIKGTTEWRNYEVVLDVPQDAKGIFFGILLSGTGTVWMNSSNVEVVATSVPTTALTPSNPDALKNLSLEK